jgi:hypothetical protein
MRSIVLPLLVALAATDAASGFTMVVLGDRTGDARPELFEQVLQEVKALKPDLLLNVGDLVEGYTKYRDTLEAEWDTIARLLRNAGVTYRLTPGNHDIYDPMSESVFTRRFGLPSYSFNYGNCHFTVLDNSRWDSAGAIPARQLLWLSQDLANARLMRWTFVFMHRSFWLKARRGEQSDRLHELFRQNGVDYVFSGHDHYYCSSVRDSTTYIQLGPSGSRFKVYDREERGAFQNYLLATVSDQAVNVAVIRPGAIMPRTVVTLDDIARLDTIDRQAMEIDPVRVEDGRVLTDSVRARIRNLTADVLETRAVWAHTGAWHIEPETVALAVSPRAVRASSYFVRLDSAADPYPLPELQVSYPYRTDKTYAIAKLLPIQRIADCGRATPERLDGRLDDRCWAERRPGTAAESAPGPVAAFVAGIARSIAPVSRRIFRSPSRVLPLVGFGDKQGRAEPTESLQVWLSHDDSFLYVAARCQESQMAAVRALAAERDGRVAEDDNLNLLFHPNPDSAVYYQLVVNPAGTVWDRRCWLEAGRRRTDDAWNADWRIATGLGRDCWTLELAIPLRSFPGSASDWGFNVCRFQARTGRVGIYQVPFVHDPDRFARLRLR